MGETHNFLTIHLKTKQVLADFAARYKGRLPDVDFVLQTSDWLPPAFNGEVLGLCRESCSERPCFAVMQEPNVLVTH